MAVLLGPNGDQSFYLTVKEHAKEIIYVNINEDKADQRIDILLSALPYLY